MGKQSFSYGGQAVIEGVMMRGPKDVAVAVRKKSGEIVTEKQKLKSSINKYPFLKWPMFRGVIALLESMIIGIKMLTFSANVLAEEEGEEEEALTSKDIALTITISIGLAILLFIVIPTGAAYFLKSYFSPIWQNTLEGVVRIGIFVLYVFAIGRIDEVKRVFMYHGAEHKTINAYEANEELIVENVRKYTTFHPRCGTSFIIIVLILTIIIYSFLHTPDLLSRLLSRIILLPVVAGIAYELLKWSGKHFKNPIVRVLIAPGKWLQKLTTAEPDDEQLEVAIVSLKEVLETEENIENKKDIMVGDINVR